MIFKQSSFQSKPFRSDLNSCKTIFFHVGWKLHLVKWEKKIENTKDCPYSPKHPNVAHRIKRENNTAIFYVLATDLDDCLPHFWPCMMVNSLHAVHDASKKNFPSLSLILSEDKKWSIFDFFAMQQVNQGWSPSWPSTQSQDRGKPSNFHLMLFLNNLLFQLFSIKSND